MKPRILDLFCGAGGAGMGYHRAGFEVVGVDINPQPHYPFEFIQGDWREAMAILPGLWERDGIPYAIHASPPCQTYTRKAANWGRKRVHWTDHPDLIGQTRDQLDEIGKPYVIENVPGAPINASMMLCGTMFGLRIQKHRLFETNWPVPALAPGACDHRDVYNPWQGAGRTAEKMRAAQDTPWIPMAGGMSRKAGVTGDLYNAIPPAYTEWIGHHLMEVIS